MYILLKSGSVIEMDRMIIPTVTGTITTIQYANKDVEGEVKINDVQKITHDRPRLMNYDHALYLTESYRTWTQLSTEGGYDDDEVLHDTIRSICHDIMDYLCHTKQVLTPNGFLPGSPNIAKPELVYVKVVQFNVFIDGGTTEYKDIHGRSYFIPAKCYGLKGIFSEWSQKVKEFPDVYKLKGIILEIVSSLVPIDIEGEPLYINRDTSHPDYKGDLGESPNNSSVIS